ncbi:hypothetical protein MNBD_GAMMA18-1523 [hydrothermal vent metagenome]|uniref:Response regulatory domain-containing protein n=1 Tax=hydrothermal vent metagenome TaxID=652676 RepID=A0A3B0ZEI2_9ZZZZ
MTDIVIVGEMICDICSKLEIPLRDAGVRIVGSSAHLHEALPLLEKQQPRVFVMDFAEQAEVSLGLIRMANIKNEAGKILLISNFTDQELILDGITVGAKGYLEQETCGIFLAKAIEAIALGEAWLSRKTVAALLERLSDFSEHTQAEEERVVYSVSSQLH